MAVKNQSQKTIAAPMIKNEEKNNPTLEMGKNNPNNFLRGVTKRFKFGGRKKLIIVFILVALCIAAGAFFLSKSYIFKKDPQKEIEQQTKNLINQVSKLVVLPQDETPTIATVSDPEKLKDQPFFANAKKGFKVLIYTNAKKAILYDPLENKIVEIAPINLGQQPIQ